MSMLYKQTNRFFVYVDDLMEINITPHSVIISVYKTKEKYISYPGFHLFHSCSVILFYPGKSIKLTYTNSNEPK